MTDEEKLEVGRSTTTSRTSLLILLRQRFHFPNTWNLPFAARIMFRHENFASS